MSETRLRCGMLVFPNLTQLDLTGPYEILAGIPDAETLLLWMSLDPVRSERGLTILPTATFAACPRLDMWSGSAPARSLSAPPACFAGGAPRRIG